MHIQAIMHPFACVQLNASSHLIASRLRTPALDSLRLATTHCNLTWCLHFANMPRTMTCSLAHHAHFGATCMHARPCTPSLVVGHIHFIVHVVDCSFSHYHNLLKNMVLILFARNAKFIMHYLVMPKTSTQCFPYCVTSHHLCFPARTPCANYT